MRLRDCEAAGARTVLGLCLRFGAGWGVATVPSPSSSSHLERLREGVDVPDIVEVAKNRSRRTSNF